MNDPRRHFSLPAFDLDFLNHRGLSWEAVIDSAVRWIVLCKYPLPKGYNDESASVALDLPQSYPDVQIDMAYFRPHLKLANGRHVRQLSTRAFDGRVWQCWSRHRTAANPWRRGYDCIETHLLLVDEWLERELRIGT